MSESLFFIQDLAVILVAATLCGYGCARIGLSPVVGYLAAGLIVGTPEITVPYVTDEERIQIIGQLGVVFLMFAIGLQFRIRRLRELGLGVICATALTALLVLTAVRFVGGIMGWDPVAALCVAAVFMVSSSAIIGKFVMDLGIGHQRFGKVALGMTLMEDIVAVVMLAVLGTYAVTDGGGGTPLGMLLFMLTGFIVTILVFGLIIVPWIFQLFERRGQVELANIFVCGAVLAVAYLAVRAGYSLALGAFAVGLVVAETKQRAVVERAFSGLKDVFLTVFFVTIGMMVDLHALPAALPWIVVGTIGALLGRAVAAFCALVIVGENPRVAWQTGLCLTPIGEFSFIIAAIGVGLGLFSDTFQVAAVGVALMTSVVSPILARHAIGLSDWLSPERVPRIDKWYLDYAALRHRITVLGARSKALGLLRKRIIQLGREFIVVSALLLFAQPVYRYLLDTGWGGFTYFGWMYWLVAIGLALVPIVAIWRNLTAMAWIVAEALTTDTVSGRRSATAIRHILHALYAVVMGIWLWNLLPEYLLGWEALVSLLAVGAFILALSWRRAVRWHSMFEGLLNDSLAGSGAGSGVEFIRLGEAGKWGYEVEEFTLPDDFAYAGLPLARSRLREQTGASIVGIERSGFRLSAIGPGTHLFAGDQVLLLGSKEQLAAAKELLARRASGTANEARMEDLVLQNMKVGEGAPFRGKTLASLDLPRQYGIQVVALRRADGTLVSPGSTVTIEEYDELLLLGSAADFKRISREWYRNEPD